MENFNKTKVMIVDDMETNRIILNEMLKDDYYIVEAENGVEAISTLLSDVEKPSLILLDIMMPVMDGFATMEFIKQDPLLSQIPVIFITAIENEFKGLSAGAVDYIIKPFSPETVKLRVSTHVELYQYRQQLEHMVERKAQDLMLAKENFLETMANLIEYRSVESGQHVMRTKELSAYLTMRLLEDSPYKAELASINFDALIKAVPLHDIGKIAIPDSILLKPGRLTPEEFKTIETHTTVGSQVISSLLKNDPEDEHLKHCYDICLHHHEKWNGAGYPEKLAGTDIPLSARIVALVDVYDALVTERCYKKAMSHDEAVKIILDSSGTHLDPIIVEAFSDIRDRFKDYEERGE